MIKLKHLLYQRPISINFINENIIEGKNWFINNGSSDFYNKSSKVSVYFTDGSNNRIWFEVNYKHLNKSKYDSISGRYDKIQKWRERAAKMWSGCARKLHNEPKQITEGGNTIMRNWTECFIEALNDPKMKHFIKKWGSDSCYKDKNVAPVIDPVNFTKMG